ncbi:MAG TPA: protein kinase [Pyrinomonadaceae bacterium]|jgi:serine/threonine protein kinase
MTTPISATRWQKIEDIFQTALDKPTPAKREAYLAEACAGDASLRAEVEKLLAQFDEAEDYAELDETEPDNRSLLSTLLSTDKDDEDPVIGNRLGAYRVEAEIGRGGMGTVYSAVRDDREFNKKVAVKLVKRGMDTDYILRRFRKERQILASLEHPFIAALLDGGTSPDGRPYFVMELVEGKNFYEYCDDNRLNLRERLRLFLKIAESVNFAHQNFVIHRDLKPSNILITAQGLPKLLDFGIAKLLNPENPNEAVSQTFTLMRAMTPKYASPEQIKGDALTFATDVYSLGVLLYEIFCGHRPYVPAGAQAHELARVICEEIPELPSAAIARNDAGVLDEYKNKPGSPVDLIAEKRASSLEQLQKELTGALDSIVMKCLEKRPRKRYAGVRDLIADIDAYLTGNALNIPFYTPPSGQDTSTTTGGNAVAVLPLKLMGKGDGDYLSLGLADALISRLSQVKRFTVRPTSSVLRYAQEETFDPLQAGRELNVNYVLDGWIKQFGGRIRISLQLLEVREGNVVWAGKFDEKSGDVLEIEDSISAQVGEALVPQLSGDEREKLARRPTDNAAAFEAFLRGRYHFNTFTEEGFAKAIAAYNQAIELDPGYALAYAGIADYYNWLGVYGVLPARECFQAAKNNSLKAIELNENLSEAHAALGFAAVAGDYDWKRGEQACRRALELNPHNAQAHVWYSLQFFMEARFDEGEHHARRGVELDPLTPFNLYNLAWCLYFARRYEDSIRQYEKTIAENPLYSIAYYGLSWTLRKIGRYEEALNASRRALELSGEDSLFNLAQYGQTLACAGRREEALEVLARLDAASAERFVSPYHTAIIYCFLGDKEKTFEYLERSFAEKEAWLVWTGVEPIFDEIRADRRFKDILRRINYPRLSERRAS